MTDFVDNLSLLQISALSVPAILMLLGRIFVILGVVAFFAKPKILLRFINVPIDESQTDTKLVKRSQLVAVTCLVFGAVLFVAGFLG